MSNLTMNLSEALDAAPTLGQAMEGLKKNRKPSKFETQMFNLFTPKYTEAVAPAPEGKIGATMVGKEIIGFDRSQIEPFFPTVEAPNIASILSNEENKKYLENSWTQVRLRNGNTINFADNDGNLLPQFKSLEERFKLTDQYKGESLIFKEVDDKGKNLEEKIDFAGAIEDLMYDEVPATKFKLPEGLASITGVENLTLPELPIIRKFGTSTTRKVETSPTVSLPFTGFQLMRNPFVTSKNNVTRFTPDLGEGEVKTIVDFAKNRGLVTNDRDLAQLAAYVKSGNFKLRTDTNAALFGTRFLGDVSLVLGGELAQFFNTISNIGYKDTLMGGKAYDPVTINGYNIETGEGRDAIRARTIMNAARDMQNAFALGSLDMSYEDISELMYADATFTDKLTQLGMESFQGIQVVNRSVPIIDKIPGLKGLRKAAIEEGAEFKSFLKRNENPVTGKTPYKTFVEAQQAYLKYRGVKEDSYLGIKNTLISGRLDRFQGIEQAKLPADQQLVIKSKIELLNKLTARRTLNKKTKGKDWETGTDGVEALRKINELTNDIQKARHSAKIPEYMKGMYFADGIAVATAATIGSIFQEFGFNPGTGELIGFGLGAATPILSDIGKAEGAGKITKVLTAPFWLSEGAVTSAINVAERKTKRFIEFVSIFYASKGTLVAANTEKLSPALRAEAEKFAGIINTIGGDQQEMALDLVTLNQQSMDELVKLGVPEEYFESTIPKLSGFAVLEAFEEQLGDAIHIGNLHDPQVMKTASEVLSARIGLTAELQSLADNLVPYTRNVEGGVAKKIVEQRDKLLLGVEKSKEKIKTLTETLEQTENLAMNEALSRSFIDDITSEQLDKNIDTIYNIMGTQLDRKALNASDLALEVQKRSIQINNNIQAEIDKITIKEKAQLKSLQKVISKDGTVKTVAAKEGYVTKNLQLDKLFELKVAVQDRALYMQNAAPFKKLDQSKELGGAEVNATALFEDLTNYMFSEDLLLKQIAKSNVSMTDTTALFKIFSLKAKKQIEPILQSFADQGNVNLDTFKQTMRKRMKKDGYVLNSQVEDAQFYRYLTEKEGIDIPIMFNFSEVFKLSAAFNRTARNLSNSLDPKAGDYRMFGSRTDNLFDEFVDVNGNSLSNMNKNFIRKIKEDYKVNYIERTQPGTLLNTLLKPKAKVSKDAKATIDFPTRTTYQKAYLDFDEISKFDATKSNEFNNSLRRSFGQAANKDGTYSFTTDQRDMIAYVDAKLLLWAKDKIVNGGAKSIDDLRNMGLDTIENAFRVNSKTNSQSLADIDRLFKPGGGFNFTNFSKYMSQKELTTLQKQKNIIRGDVNKVLQPVRDYQTQLSTDIKFVQDTLLGGTTDIAKTSQFGARVLELGDQGVEDMWKAVQNTGSNMNREAFDNVLRQSVAEHINDVAFASGKRASLAAELGSPKVLKKGEELPNRSLYLSTVYDMDFNALMNFFDDTQKTAFVKKILKQTTYTTRDVERLAKQGIKVKAGTVRPQVEHDEHFEALQSIAKVLSFENRKQMGKRVGLTGIPRGMSVESLISRAYAIRRQVVGIRYVGTEATLQAMRMQNFNFMKEVLTNREAAKVFAEVIQSGGVIDDALNKRFLGVLTNAMAKYADPEMMDDFFGVPTYVGQAGEFADKVVKLPEKGIEFGKDILKIGDTN